MSEKKELKMYKVSSDVFDRLLTEHQEWVIEVEDINKYIYGSLARASIYYDKPKKKVVCRQNRLTGTGPDWYQCIVVKDESLPLNTIQKSMSGGTAWRVMKSKINKYYTEEKFDQQLNKHQAEYNPSIKQVHFFNYKEEGVIYKYSNCVKYDINGAYASALIEIFPEAKEEILKIYNERKSKPQNKALINYFVGMMCRKGYRKTYNYIVQKVRKLMDKTINYVDGILLYANTDGFAVSHPSNLLDTSKELGDFKLEYQGDIYLYQDANYQVVQAGDTMVGNVLYQVRDLIDLREGKVVTFTKEKAQYAYKANNIKQVIKEIRQ